MGLMHTDEFRQAAASLNPRSWIIRLEEKESREASNMPGSKQRSPRDIETHPKIWREKSEFVLKSTKKKESPLLRRGQALAREQFLCELFFCERRGERSSFGRESHVTACISGLVLSLPKHKKEKEKKNSLPKEKKSHRANLNQCLKWMPTPCTLSLDRTQTLWLLWVCT